VGVVDRDFSLGAPFHSGVLATEVRAAMNSSAKHPPVLGFICGLGGREVTLPDVEKMTGIVYEAAAGKTMPPTQWIGVRE
jgi:pyruvate ferredoxin oxidoreductase alpha subunit